jgi:membrane protein DedA with SNARE-associated domain
VSIVFSFMGGAGLPAEWLVDISQIEHVLRSLAGIPPRWLYVAIGAGVAIENFFPPIPADTFVLLGAFLSAEGRVTGTGVFSVTWATNTAAALLNYRLARRWGRVVLSTRLGHWLIRPRQLERLATLYHGHGSKIIFFSRFLPTFRVLVPVFAGVSHLPFWRTALPIALASAIWYGVLVVVGAMFGRNRPMVVQALANVNSVLLVIAGVLAVGLVVIWWRTRHHPRDRRSSEPEVE